MPVFAIADISIVDLSVGTSKTKKNVKVFDKNNRLTQTVSATNKTKTFYDKNNRLQKEAFIGSNTTTFRSRNGKRLGTAVKRENSITYYNNKNQKVKTIRNDNSDKQTFYDKRNLKTGSKSKNK